MKTAQILSCIAIGHAALCAQTLLTGIWDANVVSSGVTVPFKFELASHGTEAQGWFFNGSERTPSTSGTFDRGALKLQFAQLGARLEASWKDGKLDGTFYGSRRTGNLKFHAEPQHRTYYNYIGPDISGEWELNQVRSGKGEAAWRFIVTQKDSAVTATILRIDGDTGALEGTFRGDKFVLSHFSGARAAVLEVQPQSDGTLALTMNGTTHYAAKRPVQARAEGLAAPTDPALHTGVKDPSEAFRYSFKDLNGKLVSNTDERYRNKVVIVSIMGSWCPNCHDEAPYLAELYKTYRNKGLEIVGLAFEEEEQLPDPVRLRAYVKSYGIDYAMLVCGVPDEASEKLPQLRNFNSWPTILILGKDGKFREAHAGFPSEGSGPVYSQTKKEITASVEKWLAE
jgi:thiol-disulfide isomerase/thioredoxin